MLLLDSCFHGICRRGGMLASVEMGGAGVSVSCIQSCHSVFWSGIHVIMSCVRSDIMDVALESLCCLLLVPDSCGLRRVFVFIMLFFLTIWSTCPKAKLCLLDGLMGWCCSAVELCLLFFRRCCWCDSCCRFIAVKELLLSSRSKRWDTGSFTRNG